MRDHVSGQLGTVKVEIQVSIIVESLRRVKFKIWKMNIIQKSRVFLTVPLLGIECDFFVT
jgi:hypothetical protein